MHIILLGPPGSGKGTQATKLAEHFTVPHISSGDLLRDITEEDTELGREVKALIDEGNFVSDEILFKVLDVRLEKNEAGGYILDGTPRNLPQAELLEQRHTSDVVLYYDVPDEEVVKRISARWYCPVDHTIFNTIVKPPQQEGTCDVCGGKLVQRPDDTPDHVQERLRIYHERTEPVINYYEEKGVLKRINGNQPIEAVWEETLKLF